MYLLLELKELMVYILEDVFFCFVDCSSSISRQIG